ncbi:hypothetical protein C8R44DRAFT_761810 [Mycena epipterygia]|nr:hypothetical protein C8R44DRAFT_761810 [Mycena epipterygia]
MPASLELGVRHGQRLPAVRADDLQHCDSTRDAPRHSEATHYTRASGPASTLPKTRITLRACAASPTTVSHRQLPHHSLWISRDPLQQGSTPTPAALPGTTRTTSRMRSKPRGRPPRARRVNSPLTHCNPPQRGAEDIERFVPRIANWLEDDDPAGRSAGASTLGQLMEHGETYHPLRSEAEPLSAIFHDATLRLCSTCL